METIVTGRVLANSPLPSKPVPLTSRRAFDPRSDDFLRRCGVLRHCNGFIYFRRSTWLSAERGIAYRIARLGGSFPYDFHAAAWVQDSGLSHPQPL